MRSSFLQARCRGVRRRLFGVIDEVGRHGTIMTAALHQALRDLAARSYDIRLSDTLEQTMTLLESGMGDAEIARARCLPLAR